MKPQRRKELGAAKPQPTPRENFVAACEQSRLLQCREDKQNQSKDATTLSFRRVFRTGSQTLFLHKLLPASLAWIEGNRRGSVWGRKRAAVYCSM